MPTKNPNLIIIIIIIVIKAPISDDTTLLTHSNPSRALQLKMDPLTKKKGQEANPNIGETALGKESRGKKAAKRSTVLGFGFWV